MERYFGFDLGDAESAVAVLEEKSTDMPRILKIDGEGSFITAYARTGSGELLIGERACLQADVVRRKIRFKSRFLTAPASEADVRSFAQGVLGILHDQGDIAGEDDVCFYVGCPAGWDGNTRERYRAIFENAKYPPLRIVSESRAALVSACQSKHLQVGYNILSRPVLVVDIGSSTTDFAYICGGREVEMQTAGEVALGGGIMDEVLLEEAVSLSDDPAQIRQVFEESEPWKNYCEFAARRVKEQYYTDPAYWQEHPCSSTVMIHYDRPLRLTIRMDERMADKLVHAKRASLGQRSFEETFLSSLRQVRSAITERQPELIFLTGGVSRHPLIREWCMKVFPEAVVISGTEPEFAVARGLAWSGRIDEQLRQFRNELDTLIASSTVERIVSGHMGELYRKVVDTLVVPILENAAMPVFDRWRSGEIRRLSDTDAAMQEAVTAYLHTEDARARLSAPISSWLRKVADDLEEYTLPICVKHEVPYTALSLNAYLSASDMEVRIDARDVFALEEITWLIDSVISIIVGLLCGGGGVALISGGPTGIIAGAAASLLILALGKDKMEEMLLKADLPGPVRKLVPKNAFQNRMDSISASVRQNLYDSLEKEKNDEITQRMSDQIALQIEQCLSRMAEVVEIPLG